MFKKTMICAAAAAMMGVCGVSFAQATVVTESAPRISRDGEGVVNKKVIQHANGNTTVVKKKTSYNAYGQKVVKKKVVRHTAGTTPARVAVVRTTPNRVIVHRQVTTPSTTTVIRRVD